MGYLIQYGEYMTKEYIPDKKDRSGKRSVLVWIICGLILVGFFVSGTGAAVGRMLLPGDPDITEAAIENFAGNMSNGVGFLDAATVFCKDVLDGAGVPE